MEKTILIKNAKFWIPNTLLNSIPSFLLAYTHDWNTPSAISAMILGILIFALSLTFITSLTPAQKLTQTKVFRTTIKAGSITRLIICALPLLILIIGILEVTLTNSTTFSTQPDDTPLIIIDFYSGIISHAFYQECVSSLPFHITDSRLFIPTLCITLLQGCLITMTLLIAGLLLSPIFLTREHRKEHARLYSQNS